MDADVPSITLEMVMRENPGISIPDAFQKLTVLRAQEEAKANGSEVPAPAAPAPTPAPAAAAAPGSAVGMAAMNAAAAAGAAASVSWPSFRYFLVFWVLLLFAVSFCSFQLCPYC